MCELVWNSCKTLNTSMICPCQEWPISGGKNLAPEPKSKDLLLTGHEDGTVHFWDASGVSLRHIYKVSTSTVFVGEDGHDTSMASNNEQNQSDEVEDWPPFRKVGSVMILCGSWGSKYYSSDNDFDVHCCCFSGGLL